MAGNARVRDRLRNVYFFRNMHLLLPLTASLLFVVGLILIKRAGVAGVSPITTLLLTNLSSCLALFRAMEFGWDVSRVAVTVAAGRDCGPVHARG